MIEIKLFCTVKTDSDKNFAPGVRLEVIRPVTGRLQVKGKHREHHRLVEMWIDEDKVGDFRFRAMRGKSEPHEYQLATILASLGTALCQNGPKPYLWGSFDQTNLLNLIQEYAIRMRAELTPQRRETKSDGRQ